MRLICLHVTAAGPPVGSGGSEASSVAASAGLSTAATAGSAGSGAVFETTSGKARLPTPFQQVEGLYADFEHAPSCMRLMAKPLASWLVGWPDAPGLWSGPAAGSSHCCGGSPQWCR